MHRMQRHLLTFLTLAFVLNVAVVTRWCFTYLTSANECNCRSDAVGVGVVSASSFNRRRRLTPVNDVEFFAALRRLQYTETERDHDQNARTLKDVLPTNAILPIDRNSEYWQFCMQMSSESLYTRDTHELLAKLLHSMATSSLLSLAQGDKGTQLKFLTESTDGSRSIVKMMKTRRDYEAPPDLFYFSELEKHSAEIAAYHLDRLLGWRRVPPCVGRVLNISGELEPLFDDIFGKTVYTSPAGNRCFHGHCKYYCETAHSVCGDPMLVEGSFCVLLPYDIFSRKLLRNPWRRSYSKRAVAEWQKPENNGSFCENLVHREPAYAQGRRLLDLIDLHIFDFLMGNQDRHHFESFGDVEDSAIIAIDNGRGFSRPYLDDFSILAPLYQCCKIRKSTLLRLQVLSTSSVTLGDLLERSLAEDPLTRRGALLTNQQLASVDRRVHLVLQVLERECFQAKRLSRAAVVIDDGF